MKSWMHFIALSMLHVHALRKECVHLFSIFALISLLFNLHRNSSWDGRTWSSTLLSSQKIYIIMIWLVMIIGSKHTINRSKRKFVNQIDIKSDWREVYSLIRLTELEIVNRMDYAESWIVFFLVEREFPIVIVFISLHPRNFVLHCIKIFKESKCFS